MIMEWVPQLEGHRMRQIASDLFVVASFIKHLYPSVTTILWETKFQFLVEEFNFLRPPWLQSNTWNLFYFFVPLSFFYLRPWIRSNKWYLYWLLVAALYHLPPQPMDTVMRLDVSLFLTTFASSIFRLLVLLSIYEGLRYLLTRETPRWPDIRNILKHSVVVSIAYCALIWGVDYSMVWGLDYSKWRVEDPQRQGYEFYISWLLFIGLSILVYWLRKEVKYKRHRKPDFLDMVPWYSGTSADLYKTVFDLLVSVHVFLGRFDLRMLLGGKNQVQDGDQLENKLYDLSINEELWFDFMADTGDGGNSTYTIARLLARPRICFNSHILKRGDLLLIGGDLAYPNPSTFTYERRLFKPFECALQSPVDPDLDLVAPCDAPRCFIIPGNHDWFDGLRTFTRYICDNDWLGGWYMPQKTTYFALELPQKWWIFGLDLALDGDIDTYQFRFFKEQAEKMGNKDSVIIMTHQPDWLLDWYESGDVDRDKLSYLICNILKERCKLRIAGDIHHYMRHSIVRSNGSDPSQSVYAQHLLVNGCGGAFTHPTHVFSDFRKSHGVSYECRAAYPEKEISKKLAFRNIWKFRKENSQFDFVGGIMYYILVFSMFPQCELDHVFQVDSMSDLWRIFIRTLWNAFVYMLQHSYVSLGGGLLFVIVVIVFVPSKKSWKTRVAIGICHASAHLVVALSLMLVLELGVEALVRQKLLATSGDHSLYRWYESQESRNFLLSNGKRARIEPPRFGLCPTCIKYLMFAFDVLEIMGVRQSNICKSGMASLSRWDTVLYYGSVFLYFFLLSTPAVSYVFGSYLYICVRWFNLHYDEAFSSLRIADYKAFTRFHIKPNGDLEVFTLAVDEVPGQWRRDPGWKREKKIDPGRLSHKRWFPSQWTAAAPYKDPLMTVRIIDQFVIRREDSPSSSEIEEST